MQTAIPCTLMRGGTSKGMVFHQDDLPTDPEVRDKVLLAAMGSPDPRQIDGVGGAHPLTSKVAVIGPASVPGADVDYLFLQVVVDKAQVLDTQNCGNILACVGPWAIENGLVAATGDQTPVRIHMVNTGSLAVATVQTPHGRVSYTGQARIDGVPGSHAPVSLNFLDVAGSLCGQLLPTGRPVDRVDQIDLTLIDNGMPVAIMDAASLGLRGDESPADLEADQALKSRVEKIRLAVGGLMNLGDVSGKSVPKMTLVSPPVANGAINTRSFIPHRVHEAIGVFGAVSVATACVIPDSVAARVCRLPATGAAGATLIDVEHPTGFFSVSIELDEQAEQVVVSRSALLRTARKLMRGEVYVPESVWGGPGPVIQGSASA
ncbi:MAG: 4-oxalomesaconate tautomerase [Burkholderiaceae bacterium]